MSKLISAWLKIWIPILFAMGIGILLYLITHWTTLDAGSRFVAIIYVMLPLHCLEEWRFPGGFHYNYNMLRRSRKPDCYPMNQFSDMLTIMLAELIGIVCLFYGVNQIIVIWNLIFCFFEMIGHLIFGFSMYRRFRTVGKRTIYNPGFATAVVFTLHALYYVLIQYPTNLPSLPIIILAIISGTVLVSSVVLIPEQLFKSKETPYPFDNNRYYEKYITREKN